MTLIIIIFILLQTPPQAPTSLPIKEGYDILQQAGYLTGPSVKYDEEEWAEYIS